MDTKYFTIELSAAQIVKISLALRALPAEEPSDDFETDSAADLIEMFADVQLDTVNSFVS